MKRLSTSMAVVTAVLGAVAISGGCGGGGGNTGSGGGATVAPEAACIDLLNAYCDKLAACWPLEMSFEWGDAATCKVTTPDYCKALVALNGAGYDASSAETCAASEKSASCEDNFDSAQILDGCGDVSKGTLKPGSACAAADQCDSGYCAGPTATKCGSCGKELALGDSGCKSATTFCAQGSFCDVTANKCAKLVEMGGACTSTAACAGNTYCVNGKCGAPLHAGDPCDPNDDACDPLDNISCSTSNVCQKIDLPPIAHVNQSCGLAGQNFTICDGATFCTSQTGQGTCKPRLALGKPCTVGSDGSDHCVPGSICQHGKCGLGLPTCK